MWNKKEYALSNIGEAEKKTNGSKRDMNTKPKWISKCGIYKSEVENIHWIGEVYPYVKRGIEGV